VSGKYLVVLAGVTAAVGVALFSYFGESARPGLRIDARDPARLARGRAVYEQRCAVCHGQQLEGQADWRIRLANGRMPAPPHDDTGHTWHHPDGVLLAIVRNGLVPPHAPAGYQSDMPAFRGVLSEEDIRAVLAFIASRWSGEVMKIREEMLAQSRGARR
jgi:mono/diheme cytochrome c family protein